MFTCPSCGFKTRKEKNFGSYEICILCGWEDDSLQLSNPFSDGGANSISLINSQKNFSNSEYFISDSKYQFDSSWRLFTSSEIEIYREQNAIRNWYNPSIIEYEYAYWHLNEKCIEIQEYLKSCINTLGKFENFHGITLENISDHIIEPMFVSAELDDGKNGNGWFWLLIAENVVKIKNGYTLGVNPDDKTFSILEWNSSNNNFIQVIGAESLEEALNGM